MIITLKCLQQIICYIGYTRKKTGSDTSTIFQKNPFYPCLLGNNHNDIN